MIFFINLISYSIGFCLYKGIKCHNSLTVPYFFIYIFVSCCGHDFCNLSNQHKLTYFLTRCFWFFFWTQETNSHQSVGIEKYVICHLPPSLQYTEDVCWKTRRERWEKIACQHKWGAECVINKGVKRIINNRIQGTKLTPEPQNLGPKCPNGG